MQLDPVRVLLVNDYERRGGAEIVVERTRSCLIAAGHEARVFAGDAVGLSRTPLSYIDSRRARGTLRWTLEQFRPDVVHLHNIYHLLSPGILATCARDRDFRSTRVVLTLHDHHLVCPNPGGVAWENGRPVEPHLPVGPGHALWRRRWDGSSRARSILRAAQRWWNYDWHKRHLNLDVITTPNPALQELVASWIGGCAPEIQRLENPPSSVPQPARHSDACVVVARLEPEKGVAELLEVWDPAMPLRIVGDGPERARAEQIAAQRSLDAKFTGSLEPEDAVREIAHARTLVLPSASREGWPLVIDEAVASGTPVVVSNRARLRPPHDSTDLWHIYDPDVPATLDRAISAARCKGGERPVATSAERFVDRLLGVYLGSSSDRFPSGAS